MEEDCYFHIIYLFHRQHFIPIWWVYFRKKQIGQNIYENITETNINKSDMVIINIGKK